jgi:FkbM family methyltransferase
VTVLPKDWTAQAGRLAPGLKRLVPRRVRQMLRRALQQADSTFATLDDVHSCYRLLLGRDPDADGWKTYGGRVADGIRVETLVESFLSSEEFRRRHSRDAGKAPVWARAGEVELFVDPTDFAIGQVILETKQYEPHVTEVVRSQLRPEMTFVDVGANIGYFTMLASNIVGASGRVIAFEPSARNCALLHRSLARAGRANVDLRPFALAEESLFLGYNASGSNGSISELDLREEFPLPQQVIRTSTLDAEIPEDARVDVIKMDVEGAEYRVLQGGKGVVARCRPKLVTEFSPGPLRELSKVEPEGYLEALFALGYRVAVIEEDGSLLDCGTNAGKVMARFAKRKGGHIDLLAESN